MQRAAPSSLGPRGRARLSVQQVLPERQPDGEGRALQDRDNQTSLIKTLCHDATTIGLAGYPWVAPTGGWVRKVMVMMQS
ncbi:MAG: hypothetical protein KDJ36_02830 [Hyphomicrobiaceae bacterium]|nr:hypothetical protein [Hyphomicrobiaceae bacterium]